MAEPTTPPVGETKACDSCDQIIGKSETKCPKCGVDFEALEDAVVTLEQAQKVLEKRRKAAEPKPCAKCSKVHDGECAPAPPAKKVSPLRGLGAAMRKRGQ